ncbi:MAG: hypothetical protein AAF199_06405, partial [Pseudomonadota bacterium]
NPTSGFLLFVPRRDILVLDMSVEDAAKLVISAGLITPDQFPQCDHWIHVDGSLHSRPSSTHHHQQSIGLSLRGGGGEDTHAQSQ